MDSAVSALQKAPDTRNMSAAISKLAQAIARVLRELSNEKKDEAMEILEHHRFRGCHAREEKAERGGEGIIG